MRSSKTVIVTIVVSMFVVCLIPASGRTQSIWLPHTPASSITMEYYKVNWDDRIENISFSTGTMFLTGRIAVSEAVAICAEIPISNFDRDVSIGSGGSGGQTAFGSPYLGILAYREGSTLIGEAGVRLPFVSDEDQLAREAGVAADVDRWESWIPDLMTVRARIGGRYSNYTGNVTGGNMIGGTLWIPSEGDGDPEFFIDVLGEVWFRESNFRFGADFAARILVSQSDLDFSDRTEIMLGGGVAADYGIFRPGITLHVPVGDRGYTGSAEAIDFVFGLHVTVFFPKT